MEIKSGKYEGMETKMAQFRVETSRETGEVMLFVNTLCGFRPVIGWPDAENLKDFTDMLTGIYSRINETRENKIETARIWRDRFPDDAN